MPFTTIGQTATHTTAVAASPTPTTSSFGVTNVGPLREQDLIWITVSGTAYQRGITAIVGSVLTVSPPLPGTPSAAAPVISYSEALSNDRLNAGLIWQVADVAELSATPITGMPNGTRATVTGDRGLYRLDTGSSATVDGYFVVATQSGTGRWLLILKQTVPQVVTGATAMTNGGRYIADSASRILFTLPNSPVVRAEYEVIPQGNGGYSIGLNSGQTLRYNNTAYAYGQQLSNTDAYASVRLMCTAAGVFTITHVQGSISFATVGAGYAMGGNNGGDQSSIYRLTYATETTDNPGATLDTARTRGGGGQSSTTGFCFGGLIGGSTRSALIDDLNFSNQTSAQIANTLATASFSFSVACSTLAAYRFGGSPISGITDNIWKFAFGNTTDAVLGTTLSNPCDASQAISDSANGYRLSGGGGSAATEINKFNYAGESRTTITAMLPATRQNGLTGQKPGTAGVVMGGDASGVVASILKLTLPGESLSTVAATLNTGRQQGAGVSSVVKSFALGGSLSGGSASNLIDDYDYSNDSSNQIAATLPAARIGAVGVSSLA